MSTTLRANRVVVSAVFRRFHREVRPGCCVSCGPGLLHGAAEAGGRLDRGVRRVSSRWPAAGCGRIWKAFSHGERTARDASAPGLAGFEIGGDVRIRTGDQGFAGLCLTTWLRRHLRTLILTDNRLHSIGHSLVGRNVRLSDRALCLRDRSLGLRAPASCRESIEVLQHMRQIHVCASINVAETSKCRLCNGLLSTGEAAAGPQDPQPLSVRLRARSRSPSPGSCPQQQAIPVGGPDGFPPLLAGEPSLPLLADARRAAGAGARAVPAPTPPRGLSASWRRRPSCRRPWPG